MKKFLPFLTFGFVVLGGCGLEKPPASLEFPGEKEGATNEAVEAAAPEAPLDPALAAGKAVYDMSCGACHDSGMLGAPKTWRQSCMDRPRCTGPGCHDPKIH